MPTVRVCRESVSLLRVERSRLCPRVQLVGVVLNFCVRVATSLRSNEYSSSSYDSKKTIFPCSLKVARRILAWALYLRARWDDVSCQPFHNELPRSFRELPSNSVNECNSRFKCLAIVGVGIHGECRSTAMSGQLALSSLQLPNTLSSQPTHADRLWGKSHRNGLCSFPHIRYSALRGDTDTCEMRLRRGVGRWSPVWTSVNVVGMRDVRQCDWLEVALNAVLTDTKNGSVRFCNH